MKNQRYSVNNITKLFYVQRPLWAFMLLIAISLGGQVFASEYSVSGALIMHDELRDIHGGGTLVQRIDRESGQVIATSLGDTQRILGPKGENAETLYYGNLATGTVKAIAQAANAFDHNDNIWGETLSETWVQLHDTIYFNIPAGTYADGVAAVVRGHVEGSMADSKYGQSFFGFSAVLGEEYVLQSRGDHTEAHDEIFNENFTLTDMLVHPGTTLNADLTVRQGFTMDFGGPGDLVASTLGNPSPTLTNSQSAFTSALVDFENTGRILDLSVPDGVTWTSASGVFLSEVPLPPSLLLFFGSIIGLLGFSLKRKNTQRV